jgi:hypothetical protein
MSTNFQRRITSSIGNNLQNQPAFTGRATLNQSNIRRIVLHHTGAPVRDVVRMHNNHISSDGGIPYHFLIAPQPTTTDSLSNSSWTFRVFQGTPLNLQARGVAPALRPHSICIAIAGNHSTTTPSPESIHYGRLPWGRVTITEQQRNQIEQCTSELIADCLISYPRMNNSNIGILKESRIPYSRAQNTDIDVSGIMRHDDVQNLRCPGENIRSALIISSGIDMADTFDAAEALRQRGVFRLMQDAAMLGANSAHWARNAGYPTSGTFNLGQLISSLAGSTRIGFAQDHNLEPVLASLNRLASAGVITNAARDFWAGQNLRLVADLDTLIQMAASSISR